MFTEYISLGGFCIIVVAAFLGGFLDSIAGGGGLITLPAYMVTGLPMHYVYGCNKFAASFGTTIATWRYLKHRMLDLKIGIVAAVGAFLSSTVASRMVIGTNDETLKTIMIVLLPIVAVVTLLNKNMGDENLSSQYSDRKKMVMAMLIGLAIGFYDGFVGPGTGTFALMAFCMIMKYDMRTATGNAKCLNLASNYASTLVFLINGTVLFSIAVPAMVFCMLGNYIGAGFAIKKGAKTIRKALLVVMVLLFVKLLTDMVL